MSRRQSNSKLLSGKGISSCLGAIGIGLFTSSLNADTVDEASIPGGDFSNAFATAYELPTGTLNVIGETPSLDNDYFTFNLTPGAEAFFDIFLDDTNRAFEFFDSDGNELTWNFSDNGNGATFGGRFFVPSDGELVTRFYDANVSGNYQMSLSIANIPEPSSSALLVLGSAALMSTRRRWS